MCLTGLTVLQCGHGFALNENGRCTGKFLAVIQHLLPPMSFPSFPFVTPDEDECTRFPFVCPLDRPVCINTYGSYKCRAKRRCNQGFEPSDDGSACVGEWCGPGLGGSGWPNRTIGSNSMGSANRVFYFASPDSALPPLSLQPRWPTLEAQGRLRIASGRACASGCSYRTSTQRVCCSRRFPPSLLPPMLHGDVQKLLPQPFSTCLAHSDRCCVTSWPHSGTMKEHTKAHAPRELWDLEGTV